MDNDFSGKLIAGKYRAETRLGSVGQAELYRGTNVLLEKPIILYLLDAGVAADDIIIERFFAEARTSAKVEHPNILNATDFGRDSSVAGYVVFENAAGELLSEAVEREGSLPLEMSIAITRQIAEGLSAAHSSGLVHGNLSPDVVLAAGTDPDSVVVKVFGFGSPNAIDDPEGSKDAKRFAYLAPEQCSGVEQAGERGDIHALGAITYYMLSGSPPYEGASATEVMIKNVEEPPPPLSSFGLTLPDGVEQAILKGLAKDPEARYESATEFADVLSAAASQGSLTVASAAAGSAGNNIWKTAFIVLVGISALTFGMIHLTSGRQTDPTTVQQTDPNGRPVQPINPATGVEEQNLANLPPDPTLGNTNGNPAGVEVMPGGDGYNAWANGGAPPPGGPPIGPGGRVITVPNGQSPFMTDPNCVPQPSGILLCTVPITPSPTPKATPTRKTTPADANSNTSVTPASTPVPKPSVQPTKKPASAPAKTPAPKGKPEAGI